MRVLFWTDWFLPSIGGVEVFSARLLPELVRRGHEITVVCGHHRTGLPATSDWGGVTVRRFAFHQLLAAGDPMRFAALLRSIVRLKEELAPDLVHLNTLGPSVLFQLESARRVPLPVLLTMHSPVMPDADRRDTLYGRALGSADRVNCNSFAVHRELLARVPALRERSTVTYYGMDPPALRPEPRPLAQPVVLGYGRLVADKGFDLAIRAFALVHARFPDARLVLAGDGAARPELERLAASLGMGLAVQFTGPIAPHRVPALLNTATVVVVPSRWPEPFGLVALESALMARPAVVAAVGGLPEVVEHGSTGLVVPPEDVAALAAAVSQLLADPVAADQLGAAARTRALERFSWERCVAEYHQLYQLTVPVPTH